MLFNESIELFVIVWLLFIIDRIDIGHQFLLFVDCHKLVLEKLVFEAKFLSWALDLQIFVDSEEVILNIVTRIFWQQKFLSLLGILLLEKIAHYRPFKVKGAKKGVDKD